MFFLSEETPFTVDSRDWVKRAEPQEQGVLWQTSVHTPMGRIGLVVKAGYKAILEPIEIAGSEKGLLTIGAALPGISSDGLICTLTFLGEGGERIPLASHHIKRYSSGEPWITLGFSLRAAAGTGGRLCVECEPGPEDDPSADWLAVYECVVAAPEILGLVRARAFQQWRARNEVAHVNVVYGTNEHYIINTEIIRAKLPEAAFFEEAEAGIEKPVDHEPPMEYRGDLSAFPYAHGLLRQQLSLRVPVFIWRLRERAKIRYREDRGKPLRVLSLCSGNATVEAELLSMVPGSVVDLTLMDLSPLLLEKAASRFSGYCEVRTIVADANKLKLEPGQYDVIVCVSGLHHLIELESVSREISTGLASGGEFWSIGEYVGRNGARLWEDAYAVANSFFQTLPEKYRINRVSGAAGPDSVLPNLDCSIATFESIRSEDVEDCLLRELKPHQVEKMSCFLWRLLDPAYEKNYDLNNPEDLHWVERAVAAEAEHHRSGGRPTALHGIYRKPQ